jgi:IS1 family transposase
MSFARSYSGTPGDFNRRHLLWMSIQRPMRCSRMRGKKGDRHLDPDDPPRRRANKRRGHGNYENDRPPIVGSVGRQTGEVRLRVERHTDQKTLLGHVHGYTAIEATLYTDEWRAYEKVEREHRTVSHGVREWARDDDEDGIREVHVNTIEGLWTSVRNFLRTFQRGTQEVSGRLCGDV